MAALAAITLGNNASIGIPATGSIGGTVFSPVGVSAPGVYKWVDRSGGIPVGYPTITLSVRQPNKASRICRVHGKIVVPTLEVTSPATSTGIQPAPTKAYESVVNLEFLSHERSTEAERDKALSFALSFLAAKIANADATSQSTTGSPLPPAVSDFEQPFG